MKESHSKRNQFCSSCATDWPITRSPAKWSSCPPCLETPPARFSKLPYASRLKPKPTNQKEQAGASLFGASSCASGGFPVDGLGNRPLTYPYLEGGRVMRRPRKEPMPEGYCVKCKAKKEIVDAVE